MTSPLHLTRVHRNVYLALAFEQGLAQATEKNRLGEKVEVVGVVEPDERGRAGFRVRHRSRRVRNLGKATLLHSMAHDALQSAADAPRAPDAGKHEMAQNGRGAGLGSRRQRGWRWLGGGGTTSEGSSVDGEWVWVCVWVCVCVCMCVMVCV